MRIMSLEIENVRGIRQLKIEPKGTNFLVFGPNGSGKSGVVDAIDFLLTGRISRLTGAGTKDISLKEHGPHVDTDLKSSKVKAIIRLQNIDNDIEIERALKTPGTLKFDKKYEKEMQIALQAASGGHYVLCRRELVRFITADGSTRAQQIQDLLNIPDVESARKVLQRAESKYLDLSRQADVALASSTEILQALCGLKVSELGAILRRTNVERQKLNLPSVEAIDDCCNGIATADTDKDKERQRLSFSKQLCLGLNDATSIKLETLEKDAQLRKDIEKIKNDIEIHKSHHQAQLSKLGLEALMRTEALDSCPLCDLPWEKEQLKLLLNKKIEQANFATKISERITCEAKEVGDSLNKVCTLLNQLHTNLETNEKLSLQNAKIQEWIQRVQNALSDLQSPIERFPFTYENGDLSNSLEEGAFTKELLRIFDEILPAESESSKAQVYLVNFLPLWKHYLLASQQALASRKYADRAIALHRAYVESRDEALNHLYDSVTDRFVELYRYLNSDNESAFDAEIRPESAAVIMRVGFFGKGLHPPNALHSEGHQDSMGLCLYLALMEKLNDNKIDIVVLDDVVMSVDAEHRRLVGELLSKMFTNKQFVITTHDRVWASHLSITGLVKRKNKLTFTGWDVDSGPHLADDADAWSAIDSDLARNQVNGAAARLRRWGEEFFHNCCHELKASVVYKADGRYDFGDLIFPAIGRLRELYAEAYRSAESWSLKEKMLGVKAIKDLFAKTASTFDLETALVNPNIHFNEWANFTPAEFKNVVLAYKDLQSAFMCPQCDSLLGVLSEGKTPVALRCHCAFIDLNLKKK